MKTKSEIVQRLLDEKKIDAEEACVLLMSETQPIQYVPYPVYPYYPNWPYQPPYLTWKTNGSTGTFSGNIASITSANN